MSMQAEERVAQRRRSVLELAKVLGNVSEACRQGGMTRTQFYDYKRRFELYGLEGLKDLPPVHKTHPQTTAPEVVERILALSLGHPTWGCVRLSEHLKLDGISVSSSTIQSILIKQEMGTQFDRLLTLEALAASEHIELSVEQLAAMEAANPCFRERHVESAAPGQLLAQDTFIVGHFERVGKVFLHAVVDTYCSYAFGVLDPGKAPWAAVEVLQNHVLPFYRERCLAVAKILTDNGREFWGAGAHPYRHYLACNDIGHARTKGKHPSTNGFIERFRRNVKREFVETDWCKTDYNWIEDLQEDFDRWLVHYNTKRTHYGYRNLGQPPLDIINTYVSVTKEAL